MQDMAMSDQTGALFRILDRRRVPGVLKKLLQSASNVLLLLVFGRLAMFRLRPLLNRKLATLAKG